jgi:hypothetical protein
MLEKKFYQEDKLGNKLYMRVFMDDETKENVSATIHLNLLGEKKNRLIGNYSFPDKTLYLKRNSEKHYHRISKSYGFNHLIMNDPVLDIKYILAEIDGVRYKFPKSLINDYGSFLHFKSEGFELQKFLKFALIKNFKINSEDGE